jgi:hypothetical protein
VYTTTPVYVQVQWSAAVDDRTRNALEQQFALTDDVFQGGRWTYYLRDASQRNVQALVENASVQDTAFLDKGGSSLRCVKAGSCGAPWLPRALGVLAAACAVAVALMFVMSITAWLLPERRTQLARRVLSVFAHPRRLSPAAFALLVVLLMSTLLRVELAMRGGQFYWTDERRYSNARTLLDAVETRNLGQALTLLDTADHMLFKIVAVVPAAIQQYVDDDGQSAAVLLSLCSVASIALVWFIALRAGASESEALFAAVLLASSSTFFYYARHLLPYDLAMTFGLCAVLVGVPRTGGLSRSFACGVLSGCAFLAYAGYWTLAAAAILVHVALPPWAGGRAACRRTVAAGAGLLILPLIALLVSAAHGGHLYASFLSFAGSVNQGSFAEGWRLPFEYLWHAEHGLLLLWALCLCGIAWQVPLSGAPVSVRVGLLGLGVIYGALVVTSVGLERFVVYGRLARQLVPFFCLVAANRLEWLRTRRKRSLPVAWGLLLMAVVQGLANFQAPLRQQFPDGFRERAAVVTARLAPHRYAFVNAAPIYPQPVPVHLPPNDVVMVAPHPLQYLPYQYEGYTPTQRNQLRAADIRMRLVVFRDPHEAPGDRARDREQ